MYNNDDYLDNLLDDIKNNEIEVYEELCELYDFIVQYIDNLKYKVFIDDEYVTHIVVLDDNKLIYYYDDTSNTVSFEDKSDIINFCEYSLIIYENTNYNMLPVYTKDNFIIWQSK